MTHNVCRHLRTKRMYIPAQAEEALASRGEATADSAFWCNCTMTPLGPDDRRVEPARCTSERNCYRG